MANLEGIARKFLNMLPRGSEIPAPKMQVVDILSASWAGLSEWHHNQQVSGLIKVQKAALEDETTLERIVAHEVCHYWEFYKTFKWNEGDPKNMGHDMHSMWAEAAKIINGKMGDPEFVSELSDTSYIFHNSKEFYIAVAQGMSELGWVWFSRLTPATAPALQQLLSRGPVAILRTNRDSFLSSRAKLPYIGVPKKDKAMGEQLREAYAHAKKWNPDQLEEAIRSAPKF